MATETGLGRKGSVLIGNITKYANWGNAPESGITLLCSALSCGVNTTETYNQSTRLDGNRGPRNSVGVMVERAGEIPFEFIPGGEHGWEYFLRAALYYWNEGTDKAGGGGSDLNGAVSAGDKTIELTSGTGYADNDYIQIDTGTHTTEVCKILSGGGTTTLVLYDPLNFDHADETTCNEVEAPFTHHFKLNNAANLESIAGLEKYLADLFGERFDGAMINSISLTGAVDGLITGTINVIAKSVKKLTSSGTELESGTTNATATNQLKDSTKDFNDAGVEEGSLVVNTTDSTQAYVTSVASSGICLLDNDIIVSSEDYTIYSDIPMLSESEIEALKSDIKEPYIFAKSSITKDGSDFAGDIGTATFTVNNNIQPGKAKGSGDNLSRATTGTAEVTYSFEIAYTDDDLYDDYRNGDTMAIVDTYTHDGVIPGTTDTYSMTLTIPEFKITEAPFPLEEGELKVAINGVCQYSDSDEYHFCLDVVDGTYQYPYKNL